MFDKITITYDIKECNRETNICSNELTELYAKFRKYRKKGSDISRKTKISFVKGNGYDKIKTKAFQKEEK